MSMSIPQVEQCPPMHALVLTRRCKIWQMPKLMQEGYPQLFAAVEAQGIATAGMPFAHYLNLDWPRLTQAMWFAKLWGFFTQDWHLEMAVPLVRKPQAQNGLRAVTYPACEAVTVLHHGTYGSMVNSYQALYRWLKGQGFKPANECFEFYLNDPQDTQPEELQTRILVPIRR